MKAHGLTLLTLLLVSFAAAGSSGTDGWEVGVKSDPWEIGAKETPDGVTWYGNEWTF